MKKLLFIFIAIFTTHMLSAYDFKEGDLCYNIISNIVPYEVEVTYEIEPSIFGSTSDNYSGITVVVIPESVTYSGITYSVTGIGDYAFNDCTSLLSSISLMV